MNQPLALAICATLFSLLAPPCRADSVQLFGPGLPNSTCGLEVGVSPTPCQSTFALQLETLARRAGDQLAEDTACAVPPPGASDRKRLAAALLQTARSRPGAAGAGIAAALIGTLADSVGTQSGAAMRDAVGRNFQPQPKRATCGILLAALPADAALVGFDFTETSADGVNGSCFADAGCLDGEAAFGGAPSPVVKDPGAQVFAADFRNWSSRDRTARMLLFFTLPPGATVRLVR